MGFLIFLKLNRRTISDVVFIEGKILLHLEMLIPFRFDASKNGLGKRSINITIHK